MKTDLSPQANTHLSPLSSLLLPWYRANARSMPWRESREPYRVWLSEIMLQQTRVEAVIPYFNRFIAALPDIAALANAHPDTVLKLWEGLGYYSRARNLHRAAQEVMTLHDGVFPRTHAEILALPGIGAYTAGAIASICFEAPTPAVDGNVLRVMARLLTMADPVDDPQVKRRITALLAALYPAAGRGDFTQSLMELGATLCLPGARPKCTLCPVAPLCRACLTLSPGDFPVKAPKKARRVEQRTALALRFQDRLALERRADTGLLANMWQLPNVTGWLTEEQAVDMARDWGLQPGQVISVCRHTHIFTHVEWHLLCYEISCAAAPEPFIWADEGQMAGELAIPTPFRRLLEQGSGRL